MVLLCFAQLENRGDPEADKEIHVPERIVLKSRGKSNISVIYSHQFHPSNLAMVYLQYNIHAYDIYIC